MSKKRRGGADSLTGGTYDVNPQYMNATVTQSAANTFTQVQMTMPLDRFRLTSSRVGAIEILKVYFYLGITQYTAVTNNQQLTLALTTISHSARTLPNDPTIIAQYDYVQTFTTSGVVMNVWPYVIDLTDGAGHGMICAVDSLYFSVWTANWATSTNNAYVKILYRYKNIGLPEYVGIVQSQQQ